MILFVPVPPVHISFVVVLVLVVAVSAVAALPVRTYQHTFFIIGIVLLIRAAVEEITGKRAQGLIFIVVGKAGFVIGLMLIIIVQQVYFSALPVILFYQHRHILAVFYFA